MLIILAVTKQWPLAPNSRDSLITRANVSRRVLFFQKWPLANVSESGESEQNRLANVGESGKSEQTRLANVGKSGEYLPSLLMSVGTRKIGHFMHK
jgi:hypothetical protein